MAYKKVRSQNLGWAHVMPEWISGVINDFNKRELRSLRNAEEREQAYEANMLDPSVHIPQGKRKTTPYISVTEGFSAEGAPMYNLMFFDREGMDGKQVPRANARFQLFYSPETDTVGISQNDTSQMLILSNSINVTMPNAETKNFEVQTREQNLARFLLHPDQAFHGSTAVGVGEIGWRENRFKLTPVQLHSMEGVGIMPTSAQYQQTTKEGVTSWRRARLGHDDRERMTMIFRETFGDESYGPRNERLLKLSNYAPVSVPYGDERVGLVDFKGGRRSQRGTTESYTHLFEQRPLFTAPGAMEGSQPFQGTLATYVFLSNPIHTSEGGMFVPDDAGYLGTRKLFSIPNSRNLTKSQLRELGWVAGAFYSRQEPSAMPEGFIFHKGGSIGDTYSLNNNYATAINRLIFREGQNVLADLTDYQTRQRVEVKPGSGFKFVTQPKSINDPNFKAIEEEIGIVPSGYGAKPSKPHRWADVAVMNFFTQPTADQIGDFLKVAQKAGLSEKEAYSRMRITGGMYNTMGKLVGLDEDADPIVRFKTDLDTLSLVVEAARFRLGKQTFEYNAETNVSTIFMGLIRDQMGAGRFREVFGDVDFSSPTFTYKTREKAFYATIPTNELPLGTTGQSNASMHRLSVMQQYQNEVFEKLKLLDEAGKFPNKSFNILRAANITHGIGSAPSVNLESINLRNLYQQGSATSFGEIGGGLHHSGIFQLLSEQFPDKYLSIGGLTFPPAADLVRQARKTDWHEGAPREWNLASALGNILDMFYQRNQLGLEGAVKNAARVLDEQASSQQTQQSGRMLQMPALSGATIGLPGLPPGYAVANSSDVIRLIKRLGIDPDQVERDIKHWRQTGQYEGTGYFRISNEESSAYPITILSPKTARRQFGVTDPIPRGGFGTSILEAGINKGDFDGDLSAVVPLAISLRQDRTIHGQFYDLAANEIPSLIEKISDPDPFSWLTTDALSASKGVFQSSKKLASGALKTSYSTERMENSFGPWVEDWNAFLRMRGESVERMRKLAPLGETPYQTAMDIDPMMGHSDQYGLRYLREWTTGVPAMGGASAFSGEKAREGDQRGVYSGDSYMRSIRLLDRLVNYGVGSRGSYEENVEFYLGAFHGHPTKARPGFVHSMAAGLYTGEGSEEDIVNALIANAAMQGFRSGPIGSNPEGLNLVLSAISGKNFSDPRWTQIMGDSLAGKHLLNYKGGNPLYEAAFNATIGGHSALGDYFTAAGTANTRERWRVDPIADERELEMGSRLSVMRTQRRFRKGYNDTFKAQETLLDSSVTSAGTSYVLGRLTEEEQLLSPEELVTQMLNTMRLPPPSSKAEGGEQESRYTGDGGKFEEAGIVHGGEYVIKKEDVDKIVRGEGDIVLAEIEQQLGKEKGVSVAMLNRRGVGVVHFLDAYTSNAPDENLASLYDINPSYEVASTTLSRKYDYGIRNASIAAVMNVNTLVTRTFREDVGSWVNPDGTRGVDPDWDEIHGVYNDPDIIADLAQRTSPGSYPELWTANNQIHSILTWRNQIDKYLQYAAEDRGLPIYQMQDGKPRRRFYAGGSYASGGLVRRGFAGGGWNRGQAVAAYQAGASIPEIAAEFGVSEKQAAYRLRGVKRGASPKSRTSDDMDYFRDLMGDSDPRDIPNHAANAWNNATFEQKGRLLGAAATVPPPESIEPGFEFEGGDRDYVIGTGPQGDFRWRSATAAEFFEAEQPSKADMRRAEAAKRVLGSSTGTSYASSVNLLNAYMGSTAEQRSGYTDEQAAAVQRAAGVVRSVHKAVGYHIKAGGGFKELPSGVKMNYDAGQEAFTAYQLQGGRITSPMAAEEADRSEINARSRNAAKFRSNANQATAFESLPEFISQMEELGKVIEGVGKHNDHFIKQGNQTLKVFESWTKALENADSALEAAGGDRSLIKDANINRILDVADRRLGDGRTVRETMGALGVGGIAQLQEASIRSGIERALNPWADPEYQQAKLVGALQRTGRLGAIAREELPDEAYAGGWDTGLPSMGLGLDKIRGRGAIDAIGSMSRFTSRLSGSMWALTHANMWLAEPMQRQMATYEESILRRSQVMAASGSISGEEMMAGVYGDTMRKRGAAAMYERSLGEQIYASYGGIGGIGSSALGRIAGTAGAIGNPAAMAAMMSAQLMERGSPLPPLIGLGVGTLATAVNAVGFAGGNDTVRNYTRDVSQAYNRGGILGALITTVPNIGANLGTLGQMLFEPQRFARNRAAGAADSAMMDYWNLPQTVRWESAQSYIGRLAQAYPNLTRSQLEQGSMNAFINDAMVNKGVPEEIGESTYIWNQRFNRGNFGAADSLTQNMLAYGAEGIDFSTLTQQIVSSTGFSPFNVNANQRVAQELDRRFQGMTSEERVLAEGAYSYRARELASINQTRNLAGLSVINPMDRNPYENNPQQGVSYDQMQNVFSGVAYQNPQFSAAVAPTGYQFGLEYQLQRNEMIATRDFAGANALDSGYQMAAGLYANRSMYAGSSRVGRDMMGIMGLNKMQQAQFQQVISGNPYAATQLGLANLVDLKTGLNPYMEQITGSEYRDVQGAAQRMGLSSLLLPQSQMQNGVFGLQAELTGIQRQQSVRQYTFGRDMQQMQYMMTTGDMTGLQNMMGQYGQNFNIGNGMGMWQIQNAQLFMQREQQDWGMWQQGQQLALNRRSFDLQGSQFYESMDLNQRKLNFSLSQQETEMNVGREQQLVRIGWQREDLAFSRNQLDVNFGWQQEDFDRNIRYARGRERRDLMREQERSTIRYAMSAGQMDRQEGRLDQEAKWAEERYEREKEYFEQNKQFAQEALQLQQKHFEQGRELDAERLQMAEQDHQKQLQWMTESRQLEDQQIQLEREWYTAQYQMTQTNNQAMFELDQRARDLSTNLQILTTTSDLISAAWQAGIQTGTEYEAIIKKINGTWGAAKGISTTPVGPSFGAGNGSGTVPTPPSSGNYMPINPTVGQIWTDSTGKKWVWNGRAWGPAGSSGPPMGGFVEGGFTGRGVSGEAAGVVHKNEYVVPENGALVIRGDNALVPYLKRMVELMEQVSKKPSLILDGVTTRSGAPSLSTQARTHL